MKQLPELHLGTINLPPDTITKCINILAKRGAGKSYLAGVLEEELAKNDYPFVIIDPRELIGVLENYILFQSLEEIMVMLILKYKMGQGWRT